MLRSLRISFEQILKITTVLDSFAELGSDLGISRQPLRGTI